MQIFILMPVGMRQIRRRTHGQLFLAFLAIVILNSCSSPDMRLHAEYYTMDNDRLRMQFKNHGKNVCVVLAHQDDEFPISPTLREHSLNGDTLIFIWSTRDKDSRDRERRKGEAIRAVSLLDVLPSNCYFFDFDEQTLHVHISELIQKIINIYEKYAPALIYIPAFEGGHIDHDTVHFCAMEALSVSRISADAFEFPLYTNYDNNNVIKRLPEYGNFIPTGEPEEILMLDAAAKTFKRAYWNCYRSQKLKFDLAIYFSGDADEVWNMDKVRPVPAHVYTNPPHAGKLSYESNFPFRFREFRDAIIAYRQNDCSSGGRRNGK